MRPWGQMKIPGIAQQRAIRALEFTASASARHFPFGIGRVQVSAGKIGIVLDHPSGTVLQRNFRRYLHRCG